MNKRRILLPLLIAVLVLTSCGPSPDDAGDSLNITVSIVPQAYFVERIGGEHVQVNVMVLPGQSPATYEPKPEQLAALSKAEAYISIGVAFENAWLDRIKSANPDMRMVDTTAGIERQPIQDHHHKEQEHDDEQEEGTLDPHIWLSPTLVKIQARTIYEALSELDPAHQQDYEANLNAFIADIDALIAQIENNLSGVKSRKFMVFHPSWGYFARDFGLEQIAVEIGGQEPSAQELAMLIEEAEKEGIHVVFAQPEFSTTAAKTLANEIGGEVLLISPLAEDWLENLRTVSQTFAQVLSQ